ncbi:hypothetical protein [Autumnicola musiva]|uniref:Glycoside hydrolase family 2 domain-containing protein n=1 Tax=Autumnicola musiva TaxID=3075589 RepID=A0ABU3D556_9FLAO|nr:hypothetical protein [Zunongwangia sp. F117]MDT0676536.1 hypothetical protein [Zunongwangia sp. F117]
MKPNGEDLVFITVNITDEKGRIVPTSDALLQFQLSGPGDIVATDNGNADHMTPFVSKSRKALNGKALIIVKTNKMLKVAINLH